MALATVAIRYGANFATTLNLNDGINYHCVGHSLWSGPEQVPVLSNNASGYPRGIRVKYKERPFSIVVYILAEPWSNSHNTLLNNLKKAFYRSNPTETVRVAVSRAGYGTIWIEAFPEHVEEIEGQPGHYLLKFTAPTPVFTNDVSEAPAPVVQPASGGYIGLGAPYTGSVLAEPKITLEVTGISPNWHYYRWVDVTNNSTTPLSYYPICIPLGNVTSWVTAGKLRSDLGDLRLQSGGGAPKAIYVRDNSGGANTDVKVWFVIYSLLPGETKRLRLLYGNSSATIEAEQSAVKPMFNMFTSTNTYWEYANFRPINEAAATRGMEWNYHSEWSKNLTPINYAHPDFSITDYTLIPCAGARVPVHTNTYGYAGLELTGLCPILSADVTYRTRTNGTKTPFVVRSTQGGNRWVDELTDGYDSGYHTNTVTGTNYTSGSNKITVLNARGIAVGQSLYIARNDGSGLYVGPKNVSTVDTTLNQITFTTTMGVAVTGGGDVYQYPTGYGPLSYSKTWAAGAYPTGLACGLKGVSSLQSGEWYYGAAEQVNLTFVTATAPNAVVNGTEVAITHHVTGTLSNSATGESIEVATVMSAIGDKLIIDCAARSVTYQPATGPAESRLDALAWPSVSRWWLHLEPGLDNVITFAGTNLYKIKCTLEYPTRYN